MNWTDAAISLGLIVLVVRQIRGRRLTIGGLLWPIGLVLWAACEYLGAVPDDEADIVFAGGVASIGLVLGLGCGFLTSVYRSGEVVMAKASSGAAVLWIVGMSSRMIFGLIALHGGGEAIGRLSVRLNLHSQATWATALILMALGEVVCRTVVLGFRYRRVARVVTV